MKTRSRIIILNGAGSAGKTSIANALQAITSDTFLHVAMDAFVGMLPEASFAHPDGMLFETSVEDGKPVVAIRSGPVAERAMRGMWRAVAALAAEGNNLIFDVVMLGDPSDVGIELLAQHDVSMIAVRAPLEVLEARERQRGDRAAGLARWQTDRVHRNKVYDLEIDSSMESPQLSAERIKTALKL